MPFLYHEVECNRSLHPWLHRKTQRYLGEYMIKSKGKGCKEKSIARELPILNQQETDYVI